MKKYFVLFLMLYVFGVLLRLIGQLIEGMTINWKNTLLLGEFDNTNDFGTRWFSRIALMLILPLAFMMMFYKTLTRR